MAHDLTSLDRPFTEEEIRKAVCLLPRDKAPGPDGFTGHFFKHCWQTIRADVSAAITSFYYNRCRDLNLLNKANIILIPKKEGAEDIRDFRPISLIHAVAKIITKILALRLAPFMNDLISPCQSAFIKKRSIHDNFLYVRNLTPICCDNIDLDTVLTNLPLSRANFPLKYLGLPLTPRRLKRIDFQPLVDKAASKLSAWNCRNLTQASRITLVKSVLSSQLIYLITVIKPTKGTLKDLDKIRRRFLWAGDGNISGGKCKVNWTRTTLPKKLGGLGILDLHKFSRALRLRWLWLQWTSPDKTWAGTQVPCDDTDNLLFANCTQITLGNGKKASFWGSGWLQGKRPRDIAPLLFAKTMRKKRTVCSAMEDNNWVRDLNLRNGLTTELLTEFVALWNLVATTAPLQDQEDMIRWTQTSPGHYTTSSAYKAQFKEFLPTPELASIWKVWAPQVQVLHMAHSPGPCMDQ
jgi:hypothetical protein